MNEIHPMGPAADEDHPQLFLDTETRRVAERFAPKRPVVVEAVRAIEEELRRPVAPEARDPLLAEREHTHGNFEVTAMIAQRFKDISKSTPNWNGKLTDVQRESLEGIFTKVARILAGNPNHKDHWSDIAGGAHLVVERL
jgi:hypothetical protein